MENLLLALSNFIAVPAIYRAWLDGRYAEVYFLGGSMISSMMYHLAEKSKHYMPGFKFLAPYEHTLLNLDRMFAFFSMVFFGYWYHQVVALDRTIQAWFAISVLAGGFSEIGLRMMNLSPDMHKWLFILSHTVWHVGVFATANQILKYNQVPAFGFWYKCLQ